MSGNIRITSTRNGIRHVDNSAIPVAHSSYFKNRGKSIKGWGFKHQGFRSLIDTDSAMEGDFQHRGRRFNVKNLRGGPKVDARRSIGISQTGWYRVEIPRCDKSMSGDFILEAIARISKVEFKAVNLRMHDITVTFFVEGHEVASALQDASHRMTAPNKSRVSIIVRKSHRPESTLTDSVLAKIKEVMGKKYSSTSKSLNLSNFFKDADLINADVYLSTNQHVIKAILSIISNNIPELVALDLSSNELRSLQFFESLDKSAPELAFLNVSDNLLATEQNLNPIKKLKLKEILLTGNPLQKRFKDNQLYIKAMREKFPSLLKLDQLTLPPPIEFNIGNAVMPTSQGSHFGGEMVQTQICLFIQQYMSVYDSKDRNALLGAYHEKATFSISCFSNRENNTGHYNLEPYQSSNRNLLRYKGGQIFERIKTSASAIVTFLQSLPGTQHHMESFVVDVSTINTSMIVFSVKGVFSEVANSKGHKPIRQFNRVVVAVPNGPGMAIVNEMVTITNPSHDVFEKYRKVQKENNRQAQSVPVATQEPYTQQQKDMIHLFSQQSGMNERFSAICLAENEWNYERAALKFSELQGVGSIPPEAFVR